MTITDALNWKYPGVEIGSLPGIVLEDAGSGLRIGYWPAELGDPPDLGALLQEYLASPEALAAAKADAKALVTEERNRRVDLYGGSNERTRAHALMAGIAILDKIVAGTATSEEVAVMDDYRQVVPLIAAHDVVATALREALDGAESFGEITAIIATISDPQTWP